jgi:hypothetical protein
MTYEQQLTQLLHVLDAAKESGHCAFVYTLSPNGCGEHSTILMEITNDNIDRFRSLLLNELYNLVEG